MKARVFQVEVQPRSNMECENGSEIAKKNIEILKSNFDFVAQNSTKHQNQTIAHTNNRNSKVKYKYLIPRKYQLF